MPIAMAEVGVGARILELTEGATARTLTTATPSVADVEVGA